MLATENYRHYTAEKGDTNSVAYCKCIVDAVYVGLNISCISTISCIATSPVIGLTNSDIEMKQVQFILFLVCISISSHISNGKLPRRMWIYWRSIFRNNFPVHCNRMHSHSADSSWLIKSSRTRYSWNRSISEFYIGTPNTRRLFWNSRDDNSK